MRRIHDRAAELSREDGCRRGLTVLVHGGLGRVFCARMGRSSRGLASALLYPRLISCCWAMRNRLQCHAGLEAPPNGRRTASKVDIVFPSLHGFLKLGGLRLLHVGFELVPENMSPAPMFLHSDLYPTVAPRGCGLLSTGMFRSVPMETHGWMSSAIRQCEYLDEARGRLVFLSRVHRARGELSGLRRIRLAAMVGPMQPASGGRMAPRCRVRRSGRWPSGG